MKKNNVETMSKQREAAIEICGLVEELLDNYDLTIETDERNEVVKDLDDELKVGIARLYGTAYFELEDQITQVLEKTFNQINITDKGEKMVDIQKAIDEREMTHHGIYHDIGLVLNKFTTKELAEFFMKDNECFLRYFIEDKIIADEIRKSNI